MRECAVARPDARQQHGETVLVEAAGGIHRTRVAAQQPAQRLEHAAARRRAQCLHRVARSGSSAIEHQRELAVLARRQVDLAAQLVVEVRPRWYRPVALSRRSPCRPARGAVARRRRCWLLDLLQRARNWASSGAVRRDLGPEAAQQARRGAIDGRQQLPEHAELAPLRRPARGGVRWTSGVPVPRPTARRHAGGANRPAPTRSASVRPDDLVAGRPSKRGHGSVDVDVAAAAGFLQRQQCSDRSTHASSTSSRAPWSTGRPCQAGRQCLIAQRVRRWR